MTDAQKKKVLLISIFHPELVRGGAQQICFELFNGLQSSKKFQPVLLSSVDQKYPALFKVGATITGFDLRKDEFLLLSKEYNHMWHKTDNTRFIHGFIEFIEHVEPDIVHFHHFLTIGIDLISLIKNRFPKIKIVFTFHEFVSICDSNGHMIRTFDKSLCTRSSSVRCHQCFPHVSPEIFHTKKMWMRSHLDKVDFFTCPSKFMIKFYTDWGISKSKIKQVANGQPSYNTDDSYDLVKTKANRFAFFGQLVDAKGIMVILDAIDILRAENFTDFVVELNGDNIRYASKNLQDRFNSYLAEEAELPVSERVLYFNGSYQVENLKERMSGIDWVIVPSTWWEIFCLVISEAWMFGKPVICSNIGGPAERVKDGIDGIHFPVGDARALANIIKKASTDVSLWTNLVRNVPKPPTLDLMVSEYERIYESI